MRDAPVMIGPEPPAHFAGNGMGTDSTRWLVAALLWPVREARKALNDLAARRHDWRYTLGGGEDDRDSADEELWVNARRVLRAVLPRWKTRWPMRLLFVRAAAWAVFRAVQDGGRLAFRYRVPPAVAPGEIRVRHEDDFGPYWTVQLSPF